MTNRHHRIESDPDTRVDDAVEEAFSRLRGVAQHLDEAEVRIIAEAATVAANTSRRFIYIVLVALGVVLVAVAVLSAYTFHTTKEQGDRTSQLIAGDAASQEVTSARASSLLATRADFAKANAALVAAGLTPVPDPGPGASAYQMSAVTGEALGTLRAVGEVQKRGVRLPGVSAPDPASGRFPDLVR